MRGTWCALVLISLIEAEQWRDGACSGLAMGKPVLTHWVRSENGRLSSAIPESRNQATLGDWD